MNSQIATEDLTGVEWRDTNWLEQVGGFHNQQMVMDYFANSPFWDRTCNNQMLIMQTQFNDLRQTYESTLEALRKMTGIEFAVVHEQPPVWVIQKRYRRGPTENDVNPIATYYIAGANVYQSPTIYSVVANRLLTSLFHVNSAFKEAQKLVDFHPAKGYSWLSADASAEETTENSLLQQQPQGMIEAKASANFRERMAHAIEASAERVASMRHGIDTESKASTTGDVTMQRDDTHSKRLRKKTDENANTAGKRKKKGGKQLQ